MDKKFKTKDQKKIERLEKVIDKQKKELSEVKKDRKRLNYAVERLEREKKKALDTLTPAAIKLICEYSEQVNEIEKKNEELKSVISEKEKVIADKEERYNSLLSKYKEKEVDEDKIKKQIWGDKQKFKIEVMERTVNGIVENWDGIYCQSWDDRKQLKYFNEGKRYWFYIGDEDGNFDNPIYRCSMFSTIHLIIGIHPDCGRELSGIDKYAIQQYLQTNYATQSIYRNAMNELKEFTSNNPNISEDELVEWAYHKGMELLPLYRDKIF